MEKFSITEIKKTGKRENDNGETVTQESQSDHFEAVEFFEKHRDFLEHYAKGRVNIEPAPADLKTFAFNLETNTIYVNSMFYRKRGFSNEKTLFGICHEIEHFLEKKAMLEEDGGERKFENYLARIKKSRAFGLMDNCNGDIRENRAVVSRTNAGMKDLEEETYKKDLFPETDFTQTPKHIQFCQALLREARVSDEKCQVSADVRTALDEIAKINGLADVMTNPGTPMSMRLRLQDKYLWPKVQEFLEKDMEDKKKQKQEQQEKGQSDDGQGEGQEGDGEGQTGKQKEKSEQERKENKNGAQNKQGQKAGKEEVKKDGSGSGEGSEETDPNEIFADEYEKAENKFPQAVPLEEIEKALKDWKDARSGKNESEQADGDYAKKIGVEKKDLQEYRKTVQNLEKIANPETGVGVLEELRNIFSRIISKRIKKAQAPKYPVEEGDEIVDPAQLVADVKTGNLQPKVWENTEIKEKRGDRFGEVEITLVCDRSSSMQQGQKALEQRRSAVLVMEILKEFAELCEEEKINIDKPLDVKSEIYGFGAGDDKKPMKHMSTELGESERIKIFKDLHNLPGTTTDFNCLEAVWEKMDDDSRMKIKNGELKKIIIVLTDGESDNPAKVQAVLKKMENDALAAVGVGITSEGKAVLSTYAPNAQVVEDVSRLPIVLGELLKEHLKDI